MTSWFLMGFVRVFPFERPPRLGFGGPRVTDVLGAGGYYYWELSGARLAIFVLFLGLVGVVTGLFLAATARQLDRLMGRNG